MNLRQIVSSQTLRRAAELLGETSLLRKCDIEWIGGKDNHGQGFNTGKDAMKHASSILRANPNLANRRVLLLNDNDTSAPDQNIEGLSIRTLPKNASNAKVSAGIENLLAEEAILEEFFEEREARKPNGTVTKTWSLNKMKLCNHLLENGTPAEFAGFAPALSIIRAFAEEVGASDVENPGQA